MKQQEDEYETEMGYKLAVAMRLEWAKMLGLLLRRVQSEVLGAGDGAAVKSQCEAYAGSPVPLLLVRLARRGGAVPAGRRGSFQRAAAGLCARDGARRVRRFVRL